MKTAWLTMLVAGLGVAAVQGQVSVTGGDAQVVVVEDQLATETSAAPEASVAFQAEVFRNVLGLPVQYDGAVVKARRIGNPFQLINPFAPTEYGDGFDNVSVEPTSGRAAGVNLFGIRF